MCHGEFSHREGAGARPGAPAWGLPSSREEGWEPAARGTALEVGGVAGWAGDPGGGAGPCASPRACPLLPEAALFCPAPPRPCLLCFHEAIKRCPRDRHIWCLGTISGLALRPWSPATADTFIWEADRTRSSAWTGHRSGPRWLVKGNRGCWVALPGWGPESRSRKKTRVRRGNNTPAGEPAVD